MRHKLAWWLTVYGMAVARPFLAAIWLVALYAFTVSMGQVGLWIWTIPTVTGVLAFAITRTPGEESHG